MMTISDQEITSIADLFSGRLKENSEAGQTAMRALARVLREERLPMALRIIMADMVDPDTRDSVEQCFAIKSARKAGRCKANDDRNIAVVVWHRIALHRSEDNKDNREAAYAYAEKTLGVSYSAAEK